MRVIIASDFKELKNMNVNATFIAPRVGEKIEIGGDNHLYEVMSIRHIYNGNEPVMKILVDY
ncbi:hypothetical protein [Serratia sp. Se-RSBMAAmG]|uniref:hypothetical protein n=1 Tax=Serratia sp. Se-RSBMAAmG TaxID=3043305 RepID=UPI0024AECB63|nr:hypothetical protein [Serratia sp. Se-RSBMAAmG]MDI6976495.1 hypothetical protein [Serratia sp. Se-RSBMAAmG]